MTPQNLMDYVKIYENFYEDKLCKAAVKSLKKAEWKTHEFYNYESDSKKSYNNELSVSWTQIPEFEEINNRVWSAIERYILKDFESFSDWFGGWNGYTRIRFNKYDKKTQMKLHCDHIHSMFDGQRKGVPTITVLGCLNNNYEGGELMMFGDHKIDLPAGAVVVFPSNFMYPHEVKPVTKGTRYSFVSWVW